MFGLSTYTHMQLTDVEETGFALHRFRAGRGGGRHGLDILAFGRHHEGDGELIPGWWSD